MICLVFCQLRTDRSIDIVRLKSSSLEGYNVQLSFSPVIAALWQHGYQAVSSGETSCRSLGFVLQSIVVKDV